MNRELEIQLIQTIETNWTPIGIEEVDNGTATTTLYIKDDEIAYILEYNEKSEVGIAGDKKLLYMD